MGVSQRSNGTYQVSLQTHGRTVYSTTFSDEEEARAWKETAKSALLDHDYILTREGDWLVAIVERPAAIAGGPRGKCVVHRYRFASASKASIKAKEIRARITVHRPPALPQHKDVVEQQREFHQAWKVSLTVAQRVARRYRQRRVAAVRAAA